MNRTLPVIFKWDNILLKGTIQLILHKLVCLETTYADHGSRYGVLVGNIGKSMAKWLKFVTVTWESAALNFCTNILRLPQQQHYLNFYCILSPELLVSDDTTFNYSRTFLQRVSKEQ